MKNTQLQYGFEDTSYVSAGGLDGIRALVESFYSYMDSIDSAQQIRSMHPDDLTIPKEKLTLFLCGWLGGPSLYQKKYGSISIPQVHKPFKVGFEERDAWLLCMEKAVNDQPYPKEFKKYLMAQLYVPAERIRMVNE
ncbi:MAG: group II truncated hemoglobin [Gammaproteobacteria bacterium]|nr:group II truncated hemoglobin [Gammaproteobacteria bacterium]